MRYKIIVLPFLDEVHCTVTRYGEELGTPPKAARTYVMTSFDGEPEHLYSILSFLASEVAAEEG
jgi:hypothetical protein